MRRLSLFFNACLVVLILFLTTAGSPKQVAKERKKTLNAKVKSLERDGWKVHGTTKPLRAKLSEHYDKLDNPNVYELVGTSTGCRSTTVCRSAALNSAAIAFASTQGQALRGKTLRDLGIDEGAETPVEFNKFNEACIAHYQSKIKGDLQEGIAFVKDLGNGTKEYEIYYLIDRNAAGKKLAESIREAIEASGLRGEYAESVLKFINDGIETQ